MRRGITGSSSSRRSHHCSCWVCSRHVDTVSVVGCGCRGRPRSRPTVDASRVRTVGRRGGLPRPVSRRAASGRARTRRRGRRLRLVVVPPRAAGGARVAAAGLLRVRPRARAAVKRAVVRAAAGTQRPGRRAGVCWRAPVRGRRADCGGRRGGCGRHGDGRCISRERRRERGRGQQNGGRNRLASLQQQQQQRSAWETGAPALPASLAGCFSFFLLFPCSSFPASAGRFPAGVAG